MEEMMKQFPFPGLKSLAVNMPCFLFGLVTPGPQLPHHEEPGYTERLCIVGAVAATAEMASDS